MTKYEQIKSMTVEEMADEIASVVRWNRKEVKKAEKLSGGLKQAILVILTDPLPDICKECKDHGWYKENDKCERCIITD